MCNARACDVANRSIRDCPTGGHIQTFTAYDSDLAATMTARGVSRRHQAAGLRLQSCLQPLPGTDPRNRVERFFFNKLKHFRAVATRYEKHAANYLTVKLVPHQLGCALMSCCPRSAAAKDATGRSTRDTP